MYYAQVVQRGCIIFSARTLMDISTLQGTFDVFPDFSAYFGTHVAGFGTINDAETLCRFFMKTAKVLKNHISTNILPSWISDLLSFLVERQNNGSRNLSQAKADSTDTVSDPLLWALQLVKLTCTLRTWCSRWRWFRVTASAMATVFASHSDPQWRK